MKSNAGQGDPESLAAVSRVPLLLYNFTALEQECGTSGGEAA